MKNLLFVLFIGLLTISQARAYHYICIGDDDITGLTITTQDVNESQPDTAKMVIATLTSNGQSKLFSGSEFENFGYKLLSSENELAFLKITTVLRPGGSCGRCNPDIKLENYAKLAFNNEELDFTCR